MDVGQSTAIGLYQQAAAGTFKMEEGAARKCAEIFQRFGDSITTHIDEANALQVLGGFGGFQSAIELQSGFERKGSALIDALTGLQEAALRMAAAYLRAGDLLEEAELMNSRAIAAANTGLDG